MNERNRMLLFVVLAGLVLFGWQPLMVWLGVTPPQRPDIVSTQPATAPTVEPTPGATTGPAVSSPVSPGTPGGQTPVAGATPGTATPPGTWQVMPTTAPVSVPVTIGSAAPKDATFAMQLTVDPVGGGLDRVLLNDFKAKVDSNDRYDFQHGYPGTNAAPLGLRTVRVDGQPVDLSLAAWTVTNRTDRSVTLTTTVGKDNQPALLVTQTIDLPPRDAGGPEGPRGFEALVSYRIQNLGTAPVRVSGVIVGPTFPPSNLPTIGGDRDVIAGHLGANAVLLEHDKLETFHKDRVSKEFTYNKHGHAFSWIGASGNYFTGIIRPANPKQFKRAFAEALNAAETDPLKRQVLITLDTQEITLNPGQAEEIKANAFFGPRRRDLLRNDYYLSAGIEYQHVLETTSSCAWCTFDWLVTGLMWLLNFFYMIFRDYGLAIIALVFIVRAILHPITKKSQVNMAKMTKMGPEIERIKKKYGDDKEAMNRAMLEFYKNHGATPILGCLPMFLQMPIWIALYQGLSSTFELRHAPLFWGFTWIDDLSQPDHLVKFEQTYSLLFLHIDGINIIPMLLGIAFFIQFKLQPKPPNPTPEQQQQQTMMKWMTTFLFPLMLYSSPSGLTMYILASTIFGIIESKIIRKHIDDQDKKNGSGPTIVDAEVIDRPKSGGGTAMTAKKPGGLVGWFQQLQERADALRQDVEKKQGKKKK